MAKHYSHDARSPLALGHPPTVNYNSKIFILMFLDETKTKKNRGELVSNDGRHCVVRYCDLKGNQQTIANRIRLCMGLLTLFVALSIKV